MTSGQTSEPLHGASPQARRQPPSPTISELPNSLPQQPRVELLGRAGGDADPAGVRVVELVPVCGGMFDVVEEVGAVAHHWPSWTGVARAYDSRDRDFPAAVGCRP